MKAQATRANVCTTEKPIQFVRGTLPPILLDPSGNPKLLTTRGARKWAEIFHESRSHAQADQFVYHPSREGEYWIIDLEATK